MSVLQGNPSVLKTRADALVASASSIQSAIDELRQFVVVSKSKAVAATQSKVYEATTSVDKAHQRYRGTGSALQQYQVVLAQAHRKAEEAAHREAAALREEGAASGQARAAKRTHQYLAGSNAPVQNVQHALRQYNEAAARRRNAQNALSAARADIEAARREVDAAAQQAIGLINTAISGSNDKLLDKIKNFIEQIGKTLNKIGQWVKEVLTKAVEVLKSVIKKIADILIKVLIVIAVVLVVIAVAVAAVVIAVIIVKLLIAVAAVVALLVKSVSLLVARILVALWKPLLLPLLKSFGRYVAKQIYNDLLGRKPTVEQFRPTTAQEADVQSQTRMHVIQSKTLQKGADGQPTVDKSMNSLDDFMQPMTAVDRMGNTDEAVVDIRRIQGDPPRWVVTIPSTQSWIKGMANDGYHNLPLKMLPPHILTRYEQALLDTMRSAGIGPNDQVMVQGFSQGGIMAARLAANPNSGFNVTGVLTVGAPVQDINIPAISKDGQPVAVFSVHHQSDPVHYFDNPLVNYENAPHRKSFYVPDPVVNGKVHSLIDAHNSELYERTTRELLQRNPSLDDGFSAFMKPHEGSSLKGSSVESVRHYAIRE